MKKNEQSRGTNGGAGSKTKWRDPLRRYRVLGRHTGLSLQFMLSAVVFVVIFVTMTIIGFGTMTLLHLGVLSEPVPPAISSVILMMAVLSTVIGTVLTFIFGRIPLRPLHRAAAAMRQVAGGDFSVRLDTFGGRSELSELFESFNTMAEELQSVEILREDFINNFSHEFKTPIVSIRGFARMLKNPALTAEERDEYLDIISSESQRLATLSTNVLNLTRLENQKIVSDAERFCLSEQIRRIIVVLEPKWEAKHLDLDVDMEEYDCFGSQNLLSQVWINLLDNAVKFAPENGTVSVSLRSGSDREIGKVGGALELGGERRTDDGLELGGEGGKNRDQAYSRDHSKERRCRDCEEKLICRIQNSGPPISEKGLDRIFEKFYQDDPSRSSIGNGLGLSIAAKIVSLHHGSVSARNLPAGGVEFTVELPARLPQLQYQGPK